MKSRKEIEPTSEMYENRSVCVFIKRLAGFSYEVWVGSDIDSKDFVLQFTGNLKQSRQFARKKVKK
jgi:hypothetical protein